MAQHIPNYQLGVGGGASVFNPPEQVIGATASPPAGGSNYAVPRGLTVKNGALPHLSNWTNATTGFVHTFHGGFWGSWIFEIASSSSEENRIMFSRGGFQEARGWVVVVHFMFQTFSKSSIHPMNGFWTKRLVLSILCRITLCPTFSSLAKFLV